MNYGKVDPFWYKSKQQFEEENPGWSNYFKVSIYVPGDIEWDFPDKVKDLKEALLMVFDNRHHIYQKVKRDRIVVVMYAPGS